MEKAGIGMILVAGSMMFAIGALNPVGAFENPSKGNYGAGVGRVSKTDYAYDEIKGRLASEGNFAGYNRIIGMLSDLLREQRRLFIEKHGAMRNDIALETEKEMNEASLYASQSQYRKCYKALDATHEKIMSSIISLNSGGK